MAAGLAPLWLPQLTYITHLTRRRDKFFAGSSTVDSTRVPGVGPIPNKKLFQSSPLSDWILLSGTHLSFRSGGRQQQICARSTTLLLRGQQSDDEGNKSDPRPMW
jgi:hypothetical protein